MKDPKRTILFSIPAGVFMGIHFYGLGSLVAMAIAFGAIARDCAAVWGSKRLLGATSLLYMAYVWIMAALMAASMQDYLVAIGTTFLTAATFNRDYFWRYRLLALGHQSLWLVAFLLMGSYAGTVQIAFIMGSNLLGMARFRRTSLNRAAE